MSQMIYKALFLSVLSSVGLISCRSDNDRTLDSFKVPPPKVIRAGETEAKLDLKQFDSEKNRQFDIQDQIDASAGNPQLIKTRARCRSDWHEREIHRELRVPKFRIMQIIPPELLAQDLNSRIYLCNFEFTILNDVGSAHILNLADITLSETQKPEVQITDYGNKPVSADLTLNAQLAGGLRLRLDHDRPSAGQVTCEHVWYDGGSFREVWDLKDFNERRYRTHIPQSTTTIDQPLQRCRILILENELPVAMTAFFNVIVPRPPFDIKAREVAPSATSEYGFRETKDMTHLFAVKNVPIILMEYTIGNFEEATRYIRVPQPPFPIKIRSVYLHEAKKEFISQVFSPPWLYLTAPGSTPTKADGAFQTFMVRPHSEIVLQFAIMPPGPMNCIGNIYGPLFGFYVEPPTQPIEIKEVAPNSAVLDGFFLPPPRSLFVFSLRHPWYLNSHPHRETTAYICSWP